MKLSFTTLATPGLNAIEAINLAKEYGYQGIDLRVSESNGELTLAATNGQITEMKDALASEGISLASLMLYNETGGIEEASWSRMGESIRRHMDLANRVEAASIRVAIGKKAEEMDSQTYKERIAHTLSQALTGAADEIQLLIQNHHNSLNAMECTDLIRQINHPRLGLILSTEHCLIQNEDIGEVLRQAKGMTKQLYIADINKLENGYEDVLPGTGEVPIKNFYEGIGGESFEGWVTLKWEKCWRPALAGHEVVLPYFMNYMSNLMKLQPNREG